ncbi:DUF2334 domain-containing protein [Pedobacter sp. KR3-3]|uniref:DUF2334 domain-containing protein n=1 Tax=Pedobacter albus TaxID=3113905 RepID=A0ABU7IBV4_9SPHI|nr:DUF2334 domain-containing protein [Pedobacter sp. KR3-3]MEE1946852.1 DUF2334 domain-containing protein [Pedobacter sp. KR3-3]
MRNVKYIIRLDDIAPNMDWKRFEHLERIFDELNITPIIGVIPSNSDPDLLVFPYQEGFWERIKLLDQKGWEIAIHGYRHILFESDSGILRINGYSEFVGLSLQEQIEKFKSALSIFHDHDIYPSSFMAPAHSFDENTLRALKEVGIKYITDGYGLNPYMVNDILLVPQLFANPRKMFLSGVYTFCLHLNTISDEKFNSVVKFLRENKKDFIKFNEAYKFVNYSQFDKLTRFLTKTLMQSIRASKSRKEIKSNNKN